MWEAVPTLEVIIMSGYSGELLHEAPSSEVDYTFLQKPFDVKALGQAVRRALVKRVRATP